MLAQRLLESRKGIDAAARDALGRLARQLAHHLVDVFELLDRRPVVVPLAPLRFRLEPHREGFGKVFVGMALRVPRVEMEDEALAVRLGRVVLGIRRRRRAEQLEPLAPPLELIGVVDGVAGLVAENLHAPLVLAAFDFEHLRFLELLEARMREVEGDGDAADAVRREPLVREPVVRLERDLPAVELAVEIGDAAAPAGWPRWTTPRSHIRRSSSCFSGSVFHQS